MAALHRAFALSGFCVLLLLAGCGTEKTNPVTDPPPLPTSGEAGRSEIEVDESDAYQVKFETSKGDFVVRVVPGWSPEGAKRFRELVDEKFFDECRFFRVVPNFVVQFGISGNPEVARKWRDDTIRDERVVKSNQRAFVTFAKGGPNSRTTQIFINYKDNSSLDRMGFPPFGEVIEGMDVVDKINAEYGEEPDQGRIQEEGNAFLEKTYPRLDYIKTARLVGDFPAPADKEGEKPAKPQDGDAPEAQSPEAKPPEEKPSDEKPSGEKSPDSKDGAELKPE